ncbi:hypothetical protein AB0L53_54760 [Nonomuraea sp. NPDC052129]|uniref:hypothetical protein n=1 Tax=Nonomuraea sp. NPDC052129 TaxID=3154651 RepID=UPI003419B6BC
MAVSIRSVRFNTIGLPASSAARGDAQPGDTLLAFQSADSGGHGVLNLHYFDLTWELIAEHTGSPWAGDPSGLTAGTKVWKRICGDSEPPTYFTSQGPSADGLVTIVAIAGALEDSIQVTPTTGMLSPSLIPAFPAGMELRYVAGVPGPPGTSVSWGTPSGFTPQGSSQAATWTTGALATRQVVSTAATGTAMFTASASLAAAAFTVFIAAVSSTPPPPDPPVVQPFAPGVGSSLYRYVFTRLLDRTYLGDLDLVNVKFDKRILQPGSFSATIPIPDRRTGDLVAQIIPRDETELGIGPGVITCQIYREGVCWGEYWITSAQPSRSRRDTPTIQLQGSTLDAWLSRVELQQDLTYSAVDQITIARNLLTELMALPNANIGLALQGGTSGVLRDRNYLEAESGYFGQRLVELAQVDDGFEWMINLEDVDGVLTRRWVWGYPTLGVLDPPPHLFADGRSGGDILAWSEVIDALRGATRWRARGSSASSDASTSASLISTPHEATAHLAAGWPRIDRTLSYSSVTETGTLEDYAAFWASRAAGALRVDQATVAFGKTPSLTPNNLGDTGRFYFDNEWHRPVWKTRRIIGIGVSPAERDSDEEAQLVLEGQEAPGA